MSKQTGQQVVLVVEDETIIGIALSDALEDTGYIVAGPITTTTSALAWLARVTPDFALVDLTLRDGPCTDLVRELRRRDIPFIINSGHPHDEWRDHPDFSDAPWLEKPTRYDDLVAGLLALERSALARSQHTKCAA